MTQEDISRLDHPNHYKKRESPMNAWLNVIYKMMADGCSNELIYFYIKRQKAFHESERNLADYIYLIGKNNFPDRMHFTELSGRHSVLERPLSEVNGRLFFS